MAQIRIQPKEAPTTPRAVLTVALPITALLVAGFWTTTNLEGGRSGPIEALTAARPAAQAAWTWAQGAWLGMRALEANGKAWVPAAHEPVDYFNEAEMVPVSESRGWTLYANKARGLPSLSGTPSPYDRLYIKTRDDRYAPLRWRDVK